MQQHRETLMGQVRFFVFLLFSVTLCNSIVSTVSTIQLASFSDVDIKNAIR